MCACGYGAERERCGGTEGGWRFKRIASAHARACGIRGEGGRGSRYASRARASESGVLETAPFRGFARRVRVLCVLETAPFRRFARRVRVLCALELGAEKFGSSKAPSFRRNFQGAEKFLRNCAEPARSPRGSEIRKQEDGRGGFETAPFRRFARRRLSRTGCQAARARSD